MGILRVLQIGLEGFDKNGIATLVYNFNQNIDTNKIIFDYVIPNDVKESIYKKNIENKNGKIYEFNLSKNGIKKKIYFFFPLMKFLKKNKYRIIHIHESTAYMMLYYSIICKLSRNKNIILHSHSSGFDSNGRNIKLIIHNFSKLLLPLFIKNYLACSITAAKWAFQKKYLSKVIIINNGIDIEKFKFNLEIRKKIRKELKVENNFVIGHVGRMSYSKNHIFLIKLLKEIKKIIPEVKLLLIGTGPLEYKLKEKVKSLSLEKEILFLGIKEDIQDYYQAMDLFLLPSHFEGLPIVGIEAQATGLYCLFSSNVTKEVKVSNLCEFLSVENFDSWIERIKLEKNIKRKRENYYLDVKKNGYDIKDCTNKLIELYFNLMKE